MVFAENNHRIKPCWILTYQRCGSTYLCRLLNSTELFKPKFMEHYAALQDKARPNPPPKFNKLHDILYINERSRGTMLFEYYPDIRFVRLRRRDNVAAAVSHYFFQRTNRSNMNRSVEQARGKLSEYQSQMVKYNRKALIHLYRTKASQFHYWDSFVERHGALDVFYEDAVDDPQGQVDRVLEYIGVRERVQINLDDPEMTVKLSHPQKDYYVDRLRSDLVEDGIIAVE